MSNRSVVTAAGAPAAIGPYSHAIRVGNLLFTSGQIALDAGSGQMVGDGDVAKETRQVMANLADVLEAGGASLASVVKTTIYLADMKDFAEVNAIYGEFFESEPPARSTVEVARLPKDARVEIDCVALIGE